MGKFSHSLELLFCYIGSQKTRVLFVKNLSYNATEKDLKDAFDGCESARLIRYPDTGKPRGLVPTYYLPDPKATACTTCYCDAFERKSTSLDD